MINFEYFRPKTLDEAISLYDQYGEKARLLAGGTEIVNELRSGKSNPEKIIDIKHIEDMDFMDLMEDGVRFGALYRVRDAECSAPLQQSPFNALSYAASTLGSPQVRNKATIVGNVCRSSPSADMIPPLIALGAKAKIKGKNTEKTVLVEELQTGPGKTILKSGEIVVELEIPGLPKYAGCSYYKLSPRKSLDLAVVGIAVMLETDPKISKCTNARIVLGAVGPTAIRARKAESMLAGNEINTATIEKAAKAAMEESRPIDDVRSSAWYRKQMVEAGVKHTIDLALKEIQKKG